VRGVLLACAGTTIALASLPLAAQTLPAVSAAELPRVEVTGSAIRRVQSETALPVQTISRAEIEKTGVTTAAELMGRVSANSNGLTDGASINVGGDQRGFNSANLRGIGTSSTLVLLNGRRMANFASPGDDSGVDLNNIPAAALERVEVLLDGASALYGTDAIGGVINFITRKDFQGLEANVYVGTTDEGGAGKLQHLRRGRFPAHQSPEHVAAQLHPGPAGRAAPRSPAVELHESRQYPPDVGPARSSAGDRFHTQWQADHEPPDQPVGSGLRAAGQCVPAGWHGRRRRLYL
jgi:hypothetical protein